MKKRLIQAALSLMIAALLCGCSPLETGSVTPIRETAPDTTAEQGKTSADGSADSLLCGIWIEYTDSQFYQTDEASFRKVLTEELDAIAAAGFNTVFYHVRANADAAYRSAYFPRYATLGESDFDPLAIAIEEAHKRNLKLHAWINPYRISAKTDRVDELPESSYAYRWRHDGNPDTDSRVIAWDGKLYFNPGDAAVRQLISDGVEEILQNYAVDGIHFDDYFYPTSDTEFDAGSYAKYCRSADYPLSQGDWRRANVDVLVTALYRLTDTYGVPFGISPAAPISTDRTDRNYVEYGVNLIKWMTNRGYVDYIAPQLYFGYHHALADCRFDALLKTWCAVERDDSVALYIGLAAYKIGLENEADGNEWATDTSLLATEYRDCRAAGTDGVIVYNYRHLFADEERNRAFLAQWIAQRNED